MAEKQTLWQLTEQGSKLEEMIENSINWETGEVDENYDQLTDLKDEINALVVSKGKDLIYVLRKQDNYAEAIDEEIKRLQALKKSYTKKKENLSNYIKMCMIANNIKAIETPIGKLSVVNNAESVEIYDESLIDKKFIKTKIEETISKTDIKNAIKNGEEVQGARLVRNTRLAIK
nr:MAG TPA: resistance protein [Ackermannviridae sp.]